MSSPEADDRPAAEPVRRSGAGPRWSSGTLAALVAVAAVVLLGIGATLGVALAPQRQDAPTAPNAVDIGFAQDMIVHHSQGVLMARIADQNSEDNAVKIVAYDIEYTQTAQIGQMQGWLALWGQSEINRGQVMGWMAGDSGGHSGHAATVPTAATGAAADGAIMPGMATNAELAKLKSLHGKDSDIYFLQLMIRHHQGGAPMMEFATKNAGNPVVRNFAGKMLQTQTDEVSVMTQMLRQRGAQPLPDPVASPSGSSAAATASS